MALKTDVNSLRCKRWFGFAKQKLAQLKSIDVPGKVYIVSGYKIILKALIDLAIIKAPPGINYIAKDLGEFRNFYADLFGYGKEKAVEVKGLFGLFENGSFTPQSDGWPGNMLHNNAGEDYTKLHFSYTAIPGYDEFADRYCLTVNAFPPAAFAFGVYGGVAYNYEPTFILRIQSSAIANGYCWYNYGSDALYVDSNTYDIDYGFYKIKPFSKIGVNRLYIREQLSGFISQFVPEAAAWTHTAVPYNYIWVHFNPVSNRNVFRAVYWIYAETTGLQVAEPVFLFIEFDPLADAPNDVLLYGLTSGSEFLSLEENNLPHYYLGELAIGYLRGYPGSWSQTQASYRTVVVPLAYGELAICYYELYDPVHTPIKVVINEYDAPYLYPTLNIPYNPEIYGVDERNWIFPVCTRVDEAEGLYLYWEEYCLFGDVVARHFPLKIINFKYGSPYAGWLDFPTPPGEITGFTPVKIAWDHRIVLASVYIADGDNSGTYGLLLDTERNADWILGKRFSTERLDRTTPIIFGEHPYVELRKKYSGTQWGWDYTVCDNYPQ